MTLSTQIKQASHIIPDDSDGVCFYLQKIWAIQVKNYAVYVSLHVVQVQSFQKQQQKL